jgi:hypothetical protein
MMFTDAFQTLFIFREKCDRPLVYAGYRQSSCPTEDQDFELCNQDHEETGICTVNILPGFSSRPSYKQRTVKF